MPASSHRWVVPLLGLLVGVGCGDTAPEAGANGAVRVELTLPGGAEIETVLYAISGNGVEPLTGAIDATQASTNVGITSSLPAAFDYLVTLSAESIDGLKACQGSRSFDVVPGETTNLAIVLDCSRLGDAEIEAGFTFCADVTLPSASATSATLGSTIDFSVTGVDLDGDHIEYIWTAAGGSFDTPTAPAATYTCEETGTHTVTLVLSDDNFQECIRGWVTSVTCT